MSMRIWVSWVVLGPCGALVALESPGPSVAAAQELAAAVPAAPEDGGPRGF
jgi:hypothetical protein